MDILDDFMDTANLDADVRISGDLPDSHPGLCPIFSFNDIGDDLLEIEDLELVEQFPWKFKHSFRPPSTDKEPYARDSTPISMHQIPVITESLLASIITVPNFATLSTPSDVDMPTS